MDDARLMLHICCAPDATVPWPALASEGWSVAGLFCGCNIHPYDEWERRRDAVLCLARHLGMQVIIDPYDTSEWDRRTRGLEQCAERGERCRICIALQLETVARRAVSLGIGAMCTTLTISPHKDASMINSLGAEISAGLGLEWIERVWRKRGGFKASVDASRELGLYRQRWCGCRCSIPREGAAAHHA